MKMLVLFDTPYPPWIWRIPKELKQVRRGRSWGNKFGRRGCERSEGMKWWWVWRGRIWWGTSSDGEGVSEVRGRRWSEGIGVEEGDEVRGIGAGTLSLFYFQNLVSNFDLSLSFCYKFHFPPFFSFHFTRFVPLLLFCYKFLFLNYFNTCFT